MPPRKRKASKTPQKTLKSPSPSSIISPTIDPTPEPSPPTASPASQPEPEPDIKPEIKPEIEPEIEPEIQPETTIVLPEESVPAETKTVLRVRKVVRKKIVKKLVPKISVAAEKAENSEKDVSPNAEGGDLGIKEECEPADDAKDGILKSRRVVRKRIVKKLVPKGSLAAVPLQDEIFEDNVSLDTTFQQVKMEEDTELEGNVEINEVCGQIEVKDEVLEAKDEILEAKDEILEVNDGILKVKDEILEVEDEILEVKDEILESGKDGEGLEAAEAAEAVEAKENEVMGLSERMKRRKSEIFIGGLDRDAKEEDIRSVFGKVGEILELRMMMDGQTGKNKGYAFLRYVEPSQAKRAVTEFAKVEIRGKICGAAAVQGNDVIFLGNIDKKWKKEDVMKLLVESGIENIDTITVVMDPNNTDSNRGFAFVELETNRDAQRAYKKLQKKDVLGKCRNIKVAWADSFNIPDEEDMLKVKSVYAEGVPNSWDEERLKEVFKKFGEIERIVLGRNIKSAKRRDIAFINYKTREAALSCIESFSSDELTDNDSKVNMKVALAKRVQKANQNKGQKLTANNSLKETFNPVQGLPLQDYSPAVLGTKRPLSTLGDGMYSDLRGYPRARVDTSFGMGGSSYPTIPHGGFGSSLHYQQQPVPTGYSTGSFYRSGSNTDTHQIRQGVPPYSSNLYHRYQM